MTCPGRAKKKRSRQKKKRVMPKRKGRAEKKSGTRENWRREKETWWEKLGGTNWAPYISVMQVYRFRAQHSGIYLFNISAGQALALLNLLFTL